MNATTQLLTTLRSGACLKLGGRKLASDGTLRPHGIDSHGNYVYALSAKGQQQ